MDDIWIWVTLGLLTLATLITRSSLLLLGQSVQLPPALEKALRYAPACALAAIVVPDLVFNKGQLHWSLDNYRLLAATAAGIFFIMTRNMLGTIVIGMSVFTLLRVLLG
jgi:branched-subunit amino acid transport protein